MILITLENKMTILSESEADYIIEYTGMDLLTGHALEKTPVVFFSRNGNVLEFVTILSKGLNTL